MRTYTVSIKDETTSIGTFAIEPGSLAIIVRETARDLVREYEKRTGRDLTFRQIKITSSNGTSWLTRRENL